MMSLILNALANALSTLIGALPAWSAPSVEGANTLGHYLRVIDYFVPVAGPMAFTVGMFAALPAFLALRFTLMIWSLTRGGGPS